MAVTYVAKSTSTQVNNTGHSQALPTGYQDRDILFLFVQLWTLPPLPTITFSSQVWTEAGNVQDSGNVYGRLYWCRLDSAPSSITISHESLGTDNQAQFTFYLFRGATTAGQPYRTCRSVPRTASSTSTTIVAPAISDAAAGDLGVHFAGCMAGTSARTLSVNGSGRTVAQDSGSTGSGNHAPAMGISYKTTDSAALTWTSTIAGWWDSLSLAMIPAGITPTPNSLDVTQTFGTLTATTGPAIAPAPSSLDVAVAFGEPDVESNALEGDPDSLSQVVHFGALEVTSEPTQVTPDSLDVDVAISYPSLQADTGPDTQSPLFIPKRPLVPKTDYVVHARHALTKEWLYKDIPFSDGSTFTDSLTSPTAQIVIEPDIWAIKSDSGAQVFDEWATLIYIEQGNQLVWGGIVSHIDDTGPQKTVQCIGFSAYPMGIIYDGADKSYVNEDPMVIFRYIWSWIQSQTRGNLDLVIDNVSSTVKTGTTDEPYALQWYNGTDVGNEIQTFQQLVPFDMIEQHSWTDSNKDDVSHRLIVGVPRIGEKKDVQLIEGENIVGAVTVTRDGTSYANEVQGIGAGDGSTTVRSTSSLNDGRLWRPVAWTDKTITKADILKSSTDRQLQALSSLDEIVGCTIKDHPNAQVGSFGVGDDVPVTQMIGWGAPRTILSRVTERTVDMRTNDQTLTMARSDSFSYLGTTQ